MTKQCGFPRGVLSLTAAVVFAAMAHAGPKVGVAVDSFYVANAQSLGGRVTLGIERGSAQEVRVGISGFDSAPAGRRSGHDADLVRLQNELQWVSADALLHGLGPGAEQFLPASGAMLQPQKGSDDPLFASWYEPRGVVDVALTSLAVVRSIPRDVGLREPTFPGDLGGALPAIDSLHENGRPSAATGFPPVIAPNGRGSAVPEPTVLVLMLLGVPFVLRRRGRCPRSR